MYYPNAKKPNASLLLGQVFDYLTGEKSFQLVSAQIHCVVLLRNEGCQRVSRDFEKTIRNVLLAEHCSDTVVLLREQRDYMHRIQTHSLRQNSRDHFRVFGLADFEGSGN